MSVPWRSNHARFVLLVSALSCAGCPAEHATAPRSPQVAATALCRRHRARARPIVVHPRESSSRKRLRRTACARSARVLCALSGDVRAERARNAPSIASALSFLTTICTDECLSYSCGRRALEATSGPADDDARMHCAAVDASCVGMGALCLKFLPGMNALGRERLARLSQGELRLGIDFCLGHSGFVSSCMEESGLMLGRWRCICSHLLER